MTEKKVVLIVASDLGFMCWLGLTLGAAGLDALPAKKVSDAKKLIRDFDLHVDVLVIDPKLESAEKFAESLRQAPHHAKAIALTASKVNGLATADSPFELWKTFPQKSDAKAAADWVHAVESQLTVALKTALNF
ncbi:MAG TPA: hypothetical protein VLY24_13265 [Bryobacteraceae bacterium]|nr:hypothetical protein [Bryobacteraceae bacterium]